MGAIDIKQAAETRERGVLLVDVREPDEYAEGHVRAAVNCPMKHLPSAMADFLTGAGFDAVNVAGRTSGWIRAGLPIEKGATQ